MIGSVELQPPNSMVKFFADQVDIYFEENRLEARGNVVFSDPNGRIAAERVEFDLATGTGVFHDASGIMAMGQFANPSQFAGQDPDVYFYGERIEMLPNRKYRITKGAFTTCVQPTPRWELTSGSVDITLDDYAYAQGTVLRVKRRAGVLSAGDVLPAAGGGAGDGIPAADLRHLHLSRSGGEQRVLLGHRAAAAI